jgi:hypothetical protein
MRDERSTCFLNVDLDLRAATELSELARAFEPEAMTLNCIAMGSGYFASLELATQPTDAESAIRRFVQLIEALTPRARELWDQASSRDFSIGVDAGSTPHSFEIALTPEVLRLAADVGARVTFVVYAGVPGADPST